jgi:hypothetical protein
MNSVYKTNGRLTKSRECLTTSSCCVTWCTVVTSRSMLNCTRKHGNTTRRSAWRTWKNKDVSDCTPVTSGVDLTLITSVTSTLLVKKAKNLFSSIFK